MLQFHKRRNLQIYYTVNGEIVKEMFPNLKMETEHVRK